MPVLALVGILLTGCNSANDPGGPATTSDLPTVRTPTVAVDSTIKVTYMITGSGKANITYMGGGSGFSIEQAMNAPLPWTKTVAFGDSTYARMANVNAQLSIDEYMQPDANGNYRQPPAGLSVSCAISVDGAQVSSHTSTGTGALVQCSAG